VSKGWSARVPDDEAYRRAGGRRRYNAVRQFRAELRLEKVGHLLRQGLSRAEIARRLGVHPSTVSRDIRRMFAAGQVRRCPYCGKPLPVWFRELSGAF
jgi:DNA-binding transcriptional ArsR family regulator